MSDQIRTPRPASTGALYFNGQPLPLPGPLSLSDLLAQHAIAADTVATAVNGRFVRREQRGATPLHHGDEVITFQAIVGG